MNCSLNVHKILIVLLLFVTLASLVYLLFGSSMLISLGNKNSPKIDSFYLTEIPYCPQTVQKLHKDFRGLYSQIDKLEHEKHKLRELELELIRRISEENPIVGSSI